MQVQKMATAKKTSKTKKAVDPIVEATEAEQARINAIPHDPRLDDMNLERALLLKIDEKLERILELMEKNRQGMFDVTKWYK